MNDVVHASISRAALRHNLRVLRERAGGRPVCAMIKANAYGHGVAPVCHALADAGVALWGVATLDEALEVRRLGATEPVLVARPVGDYESARAMTEQLDVMAAANLRPTVVNAEGVACLARWGRYGRGPLRVHVKADTGMGRNGCPWDQAADLTAQAGATPGIVVEGFYSHFASADEADLTFAREQTAAFRSALTALEARGIRPPLRHLANSGAIFQLPEAGFDLVRPGIALYGYSGDTAWPGAAALRPCLRLDAPIVMTKWLEPGATCGYGRTFAARRRTRLGLLPLGYADGYSRRWSNAGQVEIAGRYVPVIGRVSMDLTAVDLTDVPQAAIGARVCVIGAERAAPHSVETMARRLDTIPYEITTLLGARLRRVLTE